MAEASSTLPTLPEGRILTLPPKERGVHAAAGRGGGQKPLGFTGALLAHGAFCGVNAALRGSARMPPSRFLTD